MNEILAESWLLPMAWALVHFLWQGALVAVVLAGLLAVTRNRSSNLRYGIACGALILMALAPVITAFYVFEPAAISPPASAGAAGTNPAAAATVGGATPSTIAAVPSTIAAAPFSTTLRSLLEPRLPMLVALWLAGVALLSVVHLQGWRQVRRLRRDTRAVDERWQQALTRIAGRLGIDRTIEIFETALLEVPAVVGWWRPVVLVPVNALTGLTPQQLEAVLAHELAHIRRRDDLLNLAQLTVETLLFYHPAVWWVSRQIRIERENCCDDLAVSLCESPASYARALADLEGLRRTTPALALGADGGSLLTRVRRLVGRTEPTSTRSWVGMAVAAVVSASVAACGAAVLFYASPALADPQDEWVQNEIAEMRQDLAGTTYGSFSDAELGDFARNGIDGEDLRDFITGGYDNLAADEILSLARNGIDGEDARDYAQAGYSDLNDLLDLARNGLDGEDVRDYANAGFSDLNDLLELARNGLDGEDVRDYANAGFSDLEELMELARNGLDGEDIRDIANAGFANLDQDQLIDLARSGLDGEDIRDMAAAGYDYLSVEEMVSVARNGLDGEDVRDISKAGYTNLSTDELLELARNGVDGEDIRDYGAAGYKNLDIDEIVNLARQGMDGGDVFEIVQAGYANLSLEQLMALGRQGVDGDDLKDLQAAGYSYSIDKILELARSGELEELMDALDN